MNASDLPNLRPGEVVTYLPTRSRSTVASPPVPSREHGYRVEIRSGTGRSFITTANAHLWNRDAEYDRQQHVQQDSKPTNGREKAGGSTRRNNGAENKEIDKPWVTISRFRLSVAELIQLKKELNSGRAFVQRTNNEELERYNASHDALEQKEAAICKEVTSQFDKEMLRLHAEHRAELQTASDVGVVRSLFTSEKEFALERARCLEQENNRSRYVD